MVVASLASVVWPCGVAIRVGLAMWRVGLVLFVSVSVFARFFVINWATFFLINETGKAFASCFEKKLWTIWYLLIPWGNVWYLLCIYQSIITNFTEKPNLPNKIKRIDPIDLQVTTAHLASDFFVATVLVKILDSNNSSKLRTLCFQPH